MRRKRPRGRGRISLTVDELEMALQHCISIEEACKYLHVSRPTLIREAKLYRKEGTDKTYYEILYNPEGIGTKKGKGAGNPNLIKYTLEDLLQGKYPEYNPFLLQKRLLKTDVYMPRRCDICSFYEVRSDGKVPLRLDFIDNDTTNHKRENLRWLCFNHFYIYVGWRDKKLYQDRRENRFNPKNRNERKDER